MTLDSNQGLATLCIAAMRSLTALSAFLDVSSLNLAAPSGCRLFFPEPGSAWGICAGAGSIPASPWRRFSGPARPVLSPVKPVDTIAMPTTHGSGMRGPIPTWRDPHCAARSGSSSSPGRGIAARGRMYLFIAIGRISKCLVDARLLQANVGNKHLVAAVLHEELEQKPDRYNEPKKPDV